jgi:hypothetical protein
MLQIMGDMCTVDNHDCIKAHSRLGKTLVCDYNNAVDMSSPAVLFGSVVALYFGVLTILVVATSAFGYDPRCVYDTIGVMIPKISGPDHASRTSSSSSTVSTEASDSCVEYDSDVGIMHEEGHHGGHGPDQDVVNAESVLVQRRAVPISSE